MQFNAVGSHQVPLTDAVSGGRGGGHSNIISLIVVREYLGGGTLGLYVLLSMIVD